MPTRQNNKEHTQNNVLDFSQALFEHKLNMISKQMKETNTSVNAIEERIELFTAKLFTNDEMIRLRERKVLQSKINELIQERAKLKQDWAMCDQMDKLSPYFSATIH